jgi:hypothetical protein
MKFVPARPLQLFVLSVVFLLTLVGCGGGGSSSSSTVGGGGTGGGGNGSGNTTTGDFYIATNGNDTWSGTLASPNSSNTDGPFATISRAQQAVHGILQSPQGRTNPIIVLLRSGTYFVSQPLSFSASDSGSSTLGVVWQNYGTEKPVVSGGMQVTNWTNTAGNTWVATLPPATHYFEQLFYNGQRRLRPRLGGYLGAYFRVSSQVFVPSPETNCPADAFFGSLGYECFDRFQYTTGDPISANWTNLSSPLGNPCGAAGNAYPSGDIELYDFEVMGASKLRISCIDAASQIIYLTGPTQFNIQNNGFIPGHRYLIENVRNSLSQPGQWFLDRSVSPWTLTYLANANESPNTDTVIVPQSSQVLIATGLANVTFRGLTFAHDNFTVPDTGYAYNRLEPNVTSAISCQNCRNVTFDGVTITQSSGTGIDFTTTNPAATTAHNTFENGAIFDVGDHGIRIGSLSAGSDTDANVPQFTTVQNTVIAGFGRVFPKGFGIAQGCNHDNLYTHNEIVDGYSGGINVGALNCPVGGRNSNGPFNNVVSFNHVHNLGQGINNDFGCIYFNTSTDTNIPAGNKALNNRCHDVSDGSALDSDGYGGQGIYIDNFTGDVDVENNLVYRVSGSTVAQTCGPQKPGSANVIKNNILAFGRLAIKQQGCTPLSSSIKLFDMTNNLIYFDRGSVQAGCYSCLGGNCSDVLPATVHFQDNLYCDTKHSCTLPAPAFFSGDNFAGQEGFCTKDRFYNSLAEWQGTNEDSASVEQNPGFPNPAYPADDFSLTASPGVGFVPFQPNQAGRTSSAIPTPSVLPGFPTKAFDPSRDF